MLASLLVLSATAALTLTSGYAHSVLTRRSMLRLGFGAVLDPERLLWRPGARLISVPRLISAPSQYSNRILAPPFSADALAEAIAYYGFWRREMDRLGVARWVPSRTGTIGTPRS